MTASSGQTESGRARAAKIAGVILLFVIGAIVIGGGFGLGLLLTDKCEDGDCAWSGLVVYGILVILPFSMAGFTRNALARVAKFIGAIALYIAGAFVVGLAMHIGCDNEDWAWLGLPVYAIIAIGIFYWARMGMGAKKMRAFAESALVLIVGGFPGIWAFALGVFLSNGMCRLF
jgi:hypothetical protein